MIYIVRVPRPQPTRDTSRPWGPRFQRRSNPDELRMYATTPEELYAIRDTVAAKISNNNPQPPAPGAEPLRHRDGSRIPRHSLEAFRRLPSLWPPYFRITKRALELLEQLIHPEYVSLPKIERLLPPPRIRDRTKQSNQLQNVTTNPPILPKPFIERNKPWSSISPNRRNPFPSRPCRPRR